MIYLTRRRPEHHESRFYALHLQPDLFGPVCVVKEWGRIGSPGTVRLEVYGDETAARASMQKRVGEKIKRGYGRSSSIGQS